MSTTLKSKDEQLGEYFANELLHICAYLRYDIPAYADIHTAILQFRRAVCTHSYVCDSVDSGLETSVTIYQCVLCEHISVTPPLLSDEEEDTDTYANTDDNAYDEIGVTLSESGEPVALNPRVRSVRISSSDKHNGPRLLDNPDDL